MGSVYWPGLCNRDTYSLTTAHEDGSRLWLTINDATGVDRLQWGWGYPAGVDGSSQPVP